MMRSLGSFQLDFRPALAPWLAVALCLLLAVGCGGGGYGSGGNAMASGGTTAPTITMQPASQSVSAGSSVTFSVMATGTAPLSYQWMFDSTNISGATMASYSITSATTGNAGTYAVQVSNIYGKVTSSPAMLTVM